MDVDQSDPFTGYGLDSHTCHCCRKLGIQRAGLSQKVIWTTSDVYDAANKGCALFKMCIVRLDGVSFSAGTDELHLEIIYPSLVSGIVDCLLTIMWKVNGTTVQSIHLAAAAIPGPTNHWKLYVKITDEFLTDTPAALHTPCRPLNRWPSSKDTMAWVRERLEICDTQHFNCRILRDRLPPGRPSRLLYIPDNRSTEFKVVPMAGRAIPPYVALSYCWGNRIQLGVCTTANLSALLEGMALCELPLTVRDAVQVAIASGISWVWVDRLCIVQDDPQDVEVELRNMAGIYAKASLVLSAACAQNSEDGFLSTREAPQNFLLPFNIAGVEPGHVLLHEQYSFADSSVSFIDQRAWTFQEHAMAPRLLRFGEVQTEWRCTEAHLFDGGQPSYNNQIYRTRLFEDFLFLPKNKINPENQATSSIQKWLLLVRDFTNRSIMKQTDRLVAIAAVAAHIGQQASWDSSSYYAGLWRHDIFEQLLWYALSTDWDKSSSRSYPQLTRSKTTINTQCQLPSWSWISCRLPVEFARPPQVLPTAIMDFVGCSIKLKDPLNPYGDVLHAVLTIKAPLIYASTAPIDLARSDRMSILDKNDMDVTCNWDSGKEPGETIDIALAVFGETPGVYHGLILTEIQSQEFARIGLFRARVVRPGFVAPEPHIIVIK
jgi:hypothetical protein